MPPERLPLDPEAMSQLFKPARLEIYECLQVAGPTSIADLARRLGRPADSLYYHVKKLLAIGVIREQGTDEPENGGPGRRGAVYSVVARHLDATLDQESPSSREAWSEGAAALLRLARRNFDHAVENGEARTEGTIRNLLLRRIKVRLTRPQLKEVNRQLEALHELLCRHAENTKGELHALTCVMTPLEERIER